jgi:hypothetical protein
MPVGFTLRRVTAIDKPHLPGLAERTEFALWIGPIYPVFGPAQAHSLIDAFAPLRGIFRRVNEMRCRASF